MIKKSILIDNDSNGLRIDPGDCDGFVISEIEESKTGRIYVYYSEIDKLINCLKKIKGDRNEYS